MGKHQISKSWEALSSLPGHASKTVYDQKAEENNKNVFTNKHIMIFENNIH